MVKILTLRDANQQFARCICEVEGGEEFIITRNGTPVARLSPITGRRILTERQLAALERIREVMREGLPIGAGSSTGTRCMSGERFTLDTNILVYSVDGEAGQRRHLASEIIELAARGDCWITLQAVSEFYAVVARKRLVPRTRAAMLAQSWLDLFPAAIASESAVRFAIDRATEGHVSYWDALLIAAAAEAGCTAIVTEDLTDGTLLKGVRIVHPFAAGELPDQVRSLLGMDPTL